MPKNVTIPITDDVTSPATECISYYDVRYWVTGNPQTILAPLSPLPLVSGTPSIVLSNLQDGLTYNYSITRYCCNGTPSSAATGTFNT